ncbi:hypothetical protein D3C84_934880 [compost metagenome]
MTALHAIDGKGLLKLPKSLRRKFDADYFQNDLMENFQKYRRAPFGSEALRKFAGTERSGSLNYHEGNYFRSVQNKVNEIKIARILHSSKIRTS